MNSSSINGPKVGPLRTAALQWAAAIGLVLTVGTHCSTAAPLSALVVPYAGYQTTESYANGLQLVGNTGYFASGQEGLVILDVTDPKHIARIGALDTPGGAYSVQVVGKTAYLADLDGGFRIIDVTNPAAPVQLGEYLPETWVTDSKVVGNIAYVACTEGGMHILDITDPANPVKLSEYRRETPDFPQSASKIKIVGKTAFVAFTYLEIIDIADPANPKHISSWDKTFVTDVEVAGDLAYVCAVNEGLIALNIKDPANPVRVTRIPAPGYASSVKLAGNLAYTSSGIIDVTDPVSPVSLGSLPYQVWTDTGIQLAGDLAYIPTGSSRLEVAQVRFGTRQSLLWADPADRVIPPKTSGTLHVTSSSGLPVRFEIVSGPATVAGDQLAVQGSGKIVVKASQPGDSTFFPVEETRLVNQTYAKLADVGAFSFSTNAYGATVVGNRAYVGNDAHGLQILDITDPAKPLKLGTVESTNQVFEAAIAGNHAFIADGPGGLKVADISDPAHPAVIGHMDAGTAIAVRVYGQVAYVADFAGRQFYVVDISDPTQPKSIATIPAEGEPRYALLIGTRLYLSCGYGGVKIMDASNPAAPVLISQPYAGGQIRGIEVRGDILYVPDFSNGILLAFDITNPVQPAELGRIALDGNPRRLQIVGTQAFVVAETGGLQVVDVSNPAHMTVIGAADTGRFARDIQVFSPMIYVTDQLAGFRVFRLESTGFRPTIDVTLPAALPFGTGLPLTGTSNAGKPVTFSVASGPAQLDGGNLTTSGLGLVTVRASVEASDGFLEATREITLVSTMPGLSLHRDGALLEAVWPAGLAGVQLEGTPSLANPSVWTPLSPTVNEANGESHAALSGSGTGFLRLSHPYPGTPEPLNLTGWNRDVVLENDANPSSQPFDFESNAWFETGLEGYPNGLPANRELGNQFDPNGRYRLQPYDANNVLWLNEEAGTASLTFDQPTACSRLYILSTSTREVTGSGKVVIHYADGTLSAPQPFTSHAWFGQTPEGKLMPGVFPNVGRSMSNEAFAYGRGDFGYTMFESVVELGTGPNAGKPIASLEFIRADEPFYITGIFAVSGIRVPAKP